MFALYRGVALVVSRTAPTGPPRLSGKKAQHKWCEALSILIIWAQTDLSAAFLVARFSAYLVVGFSAPIPCYSTLLGILFIWAEVSALEHRLIRLTRSLTVWINFTLGGLGLGAVALWICFLPRGALPIRRAVCLGEIYATILFVALYLRKTSMGRLAVLASLILLLSLEGTGASLFRFTRGSWAGGSLHPIRMVITSDSAKGSQTLFGLDIYQTEKYLYFAPDCDEHRVLLIPRTSILSLGSAMKSCGSDDSQIRACHDRTLTAEHSCSHDSTKR